MKTVILHVSGTHCASCKIFIEDALNEQMGIANAQVDLQQHTVSFETTLTDSQLTLAEVLTKRSNTTAMRFLSNGTHKKKRTTGLSGKHCPLGWRFLPCFLSCKNQEY